jgi:hypothetical protein
LKIVNLKKNTKLLIILIGLILVSAAIAIFEGGSKNDDFDSDIFQVKDSVSLVVVRIENGEIINNLEKKNGKWQLNGQFAIDDNLTKIMTTILAQVQVKRPVARLNNEELFNDLMENGNQVSITLVDGSTSKFISGGNNAKSISYFAVLNSKQVYIVEIPGYNNYISGIFELTKNQWRDRVLFSSSWRTLKELEIAYLNAEDTKITFEDRFLKIQGINEMDTTALLTYLEQYEYFQINDYLVAGNYPKYDSLSLTDPIANISISDIDNSKNRQVNIFAKMKGERFYLLTDPSNQMMVVDEKRMESLLVRSNQFKSE